MCYPTSKHLTWYNQQCYHSSSVLNAGPKRHVIAWPVAVYDQGQGAKHPKNEGRVIQPGIGSLYTHNIYRIPIIGRELLGHICILWPETLRKKFAEWMRTNWRLIVLKYQLCKFQLPTTTLPEFAVKMKQDTHLAAAYLTPRSKPVMTC